MKNEMGLISQHLQDCFISLSVYDTDFLKRTVDFIQPQYFGSTVTENMMQICHNYYRQFKEAPAHHFHDEVFKQIKITDKDIRQDYANYIEKLKTVKISNRKYVLDRVSSFVRARMWEDSAVEFVDMVAAGKFEDAKKHMHTTLRKEVGVEQIGTRYLDMTRPSYYDDLDDDEFLCRTGIPELDKIIGGFKRSTFGVVVGGTKGKKSWALIHFAGIALRAGLKVLHVSHEMSEKECETRYDMMFSAQVSTQNPKDVEFRERDAAGSIIRRYTKEMPSIFTAPKVMRVRGILKKRGGALIIKKYPPRTGGIAEIEMLMDHLELYEDFIPDILINDYADIMYLPGNDITREKLNEAYLQHKRIADERNILVLTVSQIPKSRLEVAKLRRGDVAEDARKIANVDFALGLGSDKNLEKDDVIHLVIMAHRSDVMGVGCQIQTNVNIGQFCKASWAPPIEKEDDGGDV